MDVEIELKLCTQVQAGPIIVEKLLPKLNIKVEQSEVNLSNSYFDTTHRDLRKNDMGLRIRGCQNQYEQTIKTAGKGVSGLQQRPEYNVTLGLHHQGGPEKPELRLFPAEIWPSDFDLTAVQNNLICQFSTHFTRSQFLLTWQDGTQVELVWDRGDVIASDLTSPINEIELELKKGDITILFELAKHIAKLMPITIGLVSKAARGYRLRDALESGRRKNLDKIASLPCTESDILQADVKALSSYLAKVLKQWQSINLPQPSTNEASSVFGYELTTLLDLLEKIVQQLKVKQQSSKLEIIGRCLHKLQQRVASLQQRLVSNELDKVHQLKIGQVLLDLVSDEATITLQLDIMQWLTSGN
jgi:triphosphatase